MVKMKLIPVVYYGFTAMDRRFSSPMLPWIVSEIRKRDHREKLSLGVEDGHLQAYNADFEVQFAHRLIQMTRFSQADLDPSTFLYLLRDDVEQLLYCYLYQATKQSDVSELYHQMKEQNVAPIRSLSNASTLTTLCVDISPSSSNFFEVLYIGKIKVWHKKVPDTFIDDALVKFKQHDLEKGRRKLARLKSDFDLRRASIESNSMEPMVAVPKLQRSHSLLANLSIKSPDIDRKIPTTIERISESNDDDADETTSNDQAKQPDDMEELKMKLQASCFDDHNRTMVLQVDRTDLRLISPDRKVILLHKQHKDVTTCVQGVTNPEHFGFIARESNNVNTYIGYVFKCESASVASEAYAAITQAFNNLDMKTARPVISSCEHCPMVWYHKLCCEIENLTDRKTQATIFRKIDQLSDEEQTSILTKFRGAETDSLREQNEFLMMLLRAHCEMKQGRHVHDSVENRSEFLNQYLGGGNTIFMKAKRSLSNSFDHLLKRKGSKDDFAATIKDLTLPIHPAVSRENSPNADNSDSESCRSRSSTISSQDHMNAEKNLKSPMIDIFYKVGSNPKPMEPHNPIKTDAASWRQAILKRVMTPENKSRLEGRKLTKDELRTLWKKAINQSLLLVRMEKENARIKAKQEESAVKRIKLEYDELHDDVGMWDERKLRDGIPRARRGEIWQQLAEKYTASQPAIDLTKYSNYTASYDNLLKQLTAHQHAILIDLGRTFPAHSYYSSPLGPGQLALFNLLKAYSLLDVEVGYCQGLSFVAGVLLLHMEESQAFILLRHLMYVRDLRKQYLPDMVGLQVKLYQLSRLLHDRLPEVYAHLDYYEVAPTLYAAPWLLTIFASQFPLGFVTRVFDLLFLEDTDVVFRVILALLTLHKDAIIACETFEDIMNYFKHKLPQIDTAMLDRIMKQVHEFDISKQLSEYSIEYFVLQEEIQSVQPQIDAFNKLETQNHLLHEQNKALMEQSEMLIGNLQRCEKTNSTQAAQISKLETQARTNDVTIAVLSNFINTLLEHNAELEVPNDVRRILSQSNFVERRRSNTNIFNMFKKNDSKLLVKSLSTGRICMSNTDQTLLKRNDPLGQKLHETLDQIEVDDEMVSPTSSIDSGVGTPINHHEELGVSETTGINNNIDDAQHHPLSDCAINCTYNARELRRVKSVRSAD